MVNHDWPEWRTATKAAGKTDNFIGCPMWWLKLVFPLVNSKSQLVVALYLWRRRIVCGNRKTFDVPNGELTALGIHHRTKYRTLARLEAADVISISRRRKSTLTVTILVKSRRA
jgi:hypothetical protein